MDENNDKNDTTQKNNVDTPNTKTNSKRWFPLESNPTLMNQYVEKLGFSTCFYEFVDVFSMESWALEMISQPVAAVLLLYPYTQIQKLKSAKEDLILVQEGDINTAAASQTATSNQKQEEYQKCWFVKQRIGNACGTIGLLHALYNTSKAIRNVSIQPKSWLDTYYNNCPLSTTSPIDKAEYLENDTVIETLHDDATSSSCNQTSRGQMEDKTETHFIALVHVNGQLLELDGRKDGPVVHGSTNEMNLLQDACQLVVPKFIKRAADPNEVRFTILALAPKNDTP